MAGTVAAECMQIEIPTEIEAALLQYQRERAAVCALTQTSERQPQPVQNSVI